MQPFRKVSSFMTGPARAPRTRDWVERAEHDLRTAEHTLTLVDDCPFDTVCFHAQQCAEKYLKGLLTARGIGFRSIHNLIELFRLLPQPDQAVLTSLRLDVLNPYIIEGRYPTGEDPLDRPEAETAVAIAREIREAVRALLPADAHP